MCILVMNNIHMPHTLDLFGFYDAKMRARKSVEEREGAKKQIIREE